MSSYAEYYAAIDDMTEHLRTDLIGPVTEDEVLELEEPLNRYTSGILWAQPKDKSSETVDISDVMQEELFEENAEEEEKLLNINVYKPSSMGVSFTAAGGDMLHIRFSFAVYQHSQRQIEENDRTFMRHYYSRCPHHIALDTSIPDRMGSRMIYGGTLPVKIYLHVRRIYPDGSKLLTISVMNANHAANNTLENNTSALFQCRLTIDNMNGFLPVYRHHRNGSLAEETGAMLYDGIDNYSYGHGCASSHIEASGKVTSISSEFIPQYRMLQMMPRLLDHADYLSMSYWKQAQRSTACQGLSDFVEQYAAWERLLLDEQEKIKKYPSAAEKTFSDIERCIARLWHGIEVLRTDDTAWAAFCYMNEAMLLQRVHTKKCPPESVRWYPFQMAYILQILPDMTNSGSTFREVVDLLWFPTGGGKTEAYLGLSAFTIFYRRLSGGTDGTADGCSIIMRYTLRLLTLQQFERATALICACESMRKKHAIPGGEISIGLWIGSGMTPNHIEEAEEALKKLRENAAARLFGANPMQITKCPWCGSEIGLGGYHIENGHLRISCHNNKDCEFHQKLPIYVVDDDIYACKPTLLLSTVDKFARITWEAQSGGLLGAHGNQPPSLIIQDELHLISGPLGSVAGIYEIAVDEICRHYGAPPKIIASTATARNADQQIRILYNRDMVQFPPNGLSCKDSFFAVEAGTEQRPARTYVGVCSIGGTSSEMLIQIFALLVYLKHLYRKQNRPLDVIDQFYTSVGYFNSLRELGTSSNIITDRIFNEIHYLIMHKFHEEAEKYGLSIERGKSDIPPYLRNDELTSRNSAREIKDVLERLTEQCTSEHCFDYIMASNMLSVGIDIDRLGVMCMYGQPKSNSEYIQATSRVGRTNPGIVIPLYNGMRSRDKSYFEQFVYYHTTFYQYVESTSVTSYSPRAIEKALHCAFLAVIRHTIPRYNSNQSAASFVPGDPDILRIRDMFIRRAGYIEPRTAGYAGEWLDYYLQCWEELAQKLPRSLVYYDYRNEDISLLRSADNDSGSEIPTILNSVRNVEKSSDVYFVKR